MIFNVFRHFNNYKRSSSRAITREELRFLLIQVCILVFDLIFTETVINKSERIITNVPVIINESNTSNFTIVLF